MASSPQLSMLLRLRRGADCSNESSGATLPAELKRCLYLRDLILFGVASVVGAGIFVTVGIAGREAGPGLVLAFGFAGLCCMPTALCYAELATRFPMAGAIYNFLARSLGDYFAFIIGFSLLIDGVISSAAIAKACAGYSAEMLMLFHIRLPAIFVGMEVAPFISISLLAPAIVLMLGYVTYQGIEAAANVNCWLSVFNLALIIVMVVAGMMLVEVGNYTPFLPNGMVGVEHASALTFFSMLGFDAATSLAEEAIEPERTLPLAILWTVGITTAIYMAISVVFSGLVDVDNIEHHAPLAQAFRVRGAPVLAAVVAVGAVGNMATSLLGNLVRVPRFALRMASDGHLPKRLAEVDPVVSSPTEALKVCLAFSALFSSVVSFTVLVQMAAVGGLVGFSMVNASVLLCRCRPLPMDGSGPTSIPQEDAGSTRTSPGSAGPNEIPQGARAGALSAEASWEEPSESVVQLASFIFKYFVASMLFNIFWVNEFHPIIVLAAGLAMVFFGAKTGRLYHTTARDMTADSQDQQVFLMPCVPWLPLAAIIANNFIIANLPPLAMMRFVCVEGCMGSSIYFWRWGSKHGLRFAGAAKTGASSRRAYAGFDDLDEDIDDDLGTGVAQDRPMQQPVAVPTTFGNAATEDDPEGL